MVETIVGEEDVDAQNMAAEKCGIVHLPVGSRIIGFRDRDGIRGIFVFERYTGVNGSIVAHWAGRDARWIKPYMLTLGFMYIFDQLQCRKVYAEVKASLDSVRKVDEKLGFKQVARLPNYYPDDDLIIYVIDKQECVWLPDEFKEGANGQG